MMSKRIWLFCLSATFLFCHAYEIPCCNIISAQFMKQKTYILSILEYFNYIIRLGLYLTVSVITITKIDSISRFTVTIIFFLFTQANVSEYNHKILHVPVIYCSRKISIYFNLYIHIKRQHNNNSCIYNRWENNEGKSRKLQVIKKGQTIKEEEEHFSSMVVVATSLHVTFQ